MKTFTAPQRNRKFSYLIILFLFFAAGITAHFSYRYYCSMMEQRNEAAIRDYVANDLKLQADNQDQELNELHAWLDTPHISDASKGLLYERMSLIYQSMGDNINYYGSLGKALFYLNRAGKNDTVANIYGDMAIDYLLNDSLDNAQAMLDVVYDLCPIEELGNLQVESQIYRVQAQIDLGMGNTQSAFENLAKSREFIDASHTDTFEQFYYVMDDMVEAQIWMRMEHYEEAQQILTKYKGSKYFDPGHHQAIAARSLIIPYYEIATKLALKNDDISSVRANLEEAVKYCETFHFQKMELNLLAYVLDNFDTNNSQYREELYHSITAAYEQLSASQTDVYIFLTNSLLNNSIHSMQEDENKKLLAAEKIKYFFIAILFVFAMAVILYNTWQQAHMDGLTGIANRRAFNKKYWWNRNRNRKFYLMIMDIDDFKHVNDVYGHTTGDDVLRKLGKDLHSICGPHIHMYRYGGEEFVFVLDDQNESYALQFAETVRLLVSKTKWEFGETVTVSLGMSSDNITANQLEEADQNLYFSKSHGKNVVTYYNHEGEQTLYQKERCPKA